MRPEDEMGFVSRKMRGMMGSCRGHLVGVVSFVEMALLAENYENNFECP